MGVLPVKGTRDLFARRSVEAQVLVRQRTCAPRDSHQRCGDLFLILLEVREEVGRVAFAIWTGRGRLHDGARGRCKVFKEQSSFRNREINWNIQSVMQVCSNPNRKPYITFSIYAPASSCTFLSMAYIIWCSYHSIFDQFGLLK
jgi:hypothetical protein